MTQPTKTAEIARSFDLAKLGLDFIDDPYPTYAALRENSPIHECPDGSFILTRHADMVAVYRDHHVWRSDKRIEFKPKLGDSPLYEHHTTSLVFRDPPDHTRIRKLFAPAFTPRALRALMPGLESIVDRLIDDAASSGGMDAIDDFAFAIPVEIIGDMLGVPHSEREYIRRWSSSILAGLEPAPTPEQMDTGNRSVEEFKTYLRKLIAERRAGGGAAAYENGEVLSALIEAEEDGERLSEIELLHQCIFLLNAGHETTTNLIGNGLMLLLTHPEELTRLKSDPSLIDRAVEESLRYESPVQLNNRRAGEDTELGGRVLPAGSLVTLCIGAANRDPEEFPDPDRFDISREPNRHLAFGSGIHTCAGATLARAEARIGLSRLLDRFPDIHITGKIEWDRRIRFRGLVRLPVEF